MDILGIGPLELFFIFIIALIVLGPQDMVKAGRTLGRFLRKIITSESWRTIQQASRDIRTLPNRFIREAGLEDIQKDLPDAQTIRRELSLDEMKKDIEKNMQADLSSWTTPPAKQQASNPAAEAETELNTESTEPLSEGENTTPDSEKTPDSPPQPNPEKIE